MSADDQPNEEEQQEAKSNENEISEEALAEIARYDEFFDLAVSIYLRMIAESETEYRPDREEYFKGRATAAMEAADAFLEAIDERAARHRQQQSGEYDGDDPGLASDGD